jgi:hypothetical protein
MSPNPLIPAKAGTQFFRPSTGGRDHVLRAAPSTDHPKHWVPAFAGMSGI